MLSILHVWSRIGRRLSSPTASYAGFPCRYNSVLIERKGPIATIILNRPDRRNAIDLNTAKELANIVREFDHDHSIKAGVLWGQGGNFCSGADLKAIEEGSVNRLEEYGDGPLGISRFELSKPLIAAVSGYAVAGGLELALLCDMRVVEESAVFGVFCRRFGVPLIDGGTVRLPRLIGLSRALDMILTGRSVDAKEAYMMGLANRIVPDGSSRQAAEELAFQLTEFPQNCMLADRKSAMDQFHYSMKDAISNEFRNAQYIARTKIYEGVKKFNKKDFKRS